MYNVVDSLNAVRFYEPSDPYFYSVDNRPLSDLDENISKVANAIDGSYLGNKLTQTLLANMLSMQAVDDGDLYIGEPVSTNGLTVTLPPGLLLFPEAYSDEDSRATRRLGVAYDAYSTTLTAPGSSGRTYLIQVKPVSVSSAPDTVPFVTNQPEFSKETSTVDVLQYSVKTAAYSTSPTGILADSGWVGIVRINIPNSVSTISENTISYLEPFRFIQDFGSRQDQHTRIVANDNNMELDLSLGRFFDISLTSSCEIDFRKLPKYGVTDVTLRFVQDSTGNRVVSFPANSVFVSGASDMVAKPAGAETWVRMVSLSGGNWRVFSL